MKSVIVLVVLAFSGSILGCHTTGKAVHRAGEGVEKAGNKIENAGKK